MSDLPVPNGLEYLSFQKAGIEFCSTRSTSLLADDMGLGKTIQAIGVINKLKAKKILIVCPSSVKLNWQNELKKWLTVPRSSFIVSGMSCEIPKEVDIIIVNYDLIYIPYIYHQIYARKYAILICDEAHYLKTLETKRTQAVLSRKGFVHRATYRMMMTGTPILNRPIELYPMLKVLANKDIEPYNDFYKFAYRYCGAYQTDYGLNVRGSSHLAELNKRLKNFMVRRMKGEVMRELPPRRYQIIEIESPEPLPQVNYDSLVELANIRKRIAIMKVDLCIRHIYDIMYDVKKLVIFCHHRKVISDLRFKLGEYNPIVVHGGHSWREKHKACEMFNKYESRRIFIGQIQAAGQGVDLKVAHTILFVELSWVPGEIRQCVDRCHRIGQDESVLVQFLVIKDSVESSMIRSVMRKIKVIKKALD